MTSFDRLAGFTMRGALYKSAQGITGPTQSNDRLPSQ